MPEDLLVSVIEMVRRHPWWRARARLALDVLKRNNVSPPASVFDVGCGWAVNLTALEDAGYRVTGLDISRRILALIDAPSRRLIEADLTQPPRAVADPAEALLALDVIEHIDDDRTALRNMAALLRPGGIAVVSVPALPELFSEFDEIQGHRRRYLPDSLHAAFDDTGLAVRSIFWWGAWMVPVLRRMRSRAGKSRPRTYADYLRLPRWPGPQLMALAFAVERRLAPKEWLSTGTSLFAVAARTSS
jgi:SAM-dependent methyltransferase